MQSTTTRHETTERRGTLTVPAVVRSGRFGVSLVVRATDRAALDSAASAVAAMLREAGIEPLPEDERPAA